MKYCNCLNHIRLSVRILESIVLASSWCAYNYVTCLMVLVQNLIWKRSFLFLFVIKSTHSHFFSPFFLLKLPNLLLLTTFALLSFKWFTHLDEFPHGGIYSLDSSWVLNNFPLQYLEQGKARKGVSYLPITWELKLHYFSNARLLGKLMGVWNIGFDSRRRTN